MVIEIFEEFRFGLTDSCSLPRAGRRYRRQLLCLSASQLRKKSASSARYSTVVNECLYALRTKVYMTIHQLSGEKRELIVQLTYL